MKNEISTSKALENSLVEVTEKEDFFYKFANYQQIILEKDIQIIQSNK